MKSPTTSDASTRPILFREYPELEKEIPWISLGTYPTPIRQLQRLGDGNLWIKRDDLSSPIYGGNKIRKLEFILANAKRRNTRQVITFGGIGTNHGLATAIFCSHLDITCKLLLFWQPVTAHVQQNLLLFGKYNTQLVYKKTLWRTVIGYYLTERIKHPGAYFIYAGGSSIVGTIGYVNAAYELKAQVNRGEIPSPAVIICPLSSGGTLGGLALGVQLAGLNTRVIGIRVAQSYLGPFHACTAKTVKTLMNKTYALLRNACRQIPDISLEPPQIKHDYFGDGYGFPTAEGNEAYHIARKYEDLRLDPTYTAKTFAAVLDYGLRPRETPGPILFWNTYNSIDLSNLAASVDYRELPQSLHIFFEQKAISI